MSKHSRAFVFVFATLLLILQAYGDVHAQEMTAALRVEGTRVEVTGRFSGGRTGRNFALLREYAGASDLAKRVEGVEFTDTTGRVVGHKELMPGEYLADGDIAGWRYSVSLKPLARATSAAHISWIHDGQGILMLGDLLPQVGRSAARVTVTVPEGGRIYTAEKDLGNGVFEVADAENAVFFVGREMRQISIASEPGLKLLTFGSWHFSDAEAASAAGDVFRAYRKIFGKDAGGAMVTLLKFPQAVPPGTWEADTRGSTVTIVSSDMPFKSQGIQRLHEQLRHELFHLWIPNGVALSGNYDWFYEGFTLYQSLKTGVAMNRISFGDYLDTLGRAYDISRDSRVSLIEASKKRWAGMNTQVYAKGMVTAFMADVAMLSESGGKRSIEDIFRDVFARHGRGTVHTDGSEAVIAILSARPELKRIVDGHIRGAEPINWDTELRSAGIESREVNLLTKLSVSARPNGRQKDLLDKLGYNNWRKLSPVSK